MFKAGDPFKLSTERCTVNRQLHGYDMHGNTKFSIQLTQRRLALLINYLLEHA